MKLYISPASCSMAPHIVLNELKLPFTTVRVDLKAKQSSEGDFYKINSKGSVPALQLDNGEVLTEAAVIMQYLADLKPEAKLAPSAGDFNRYRFQEWLNYVATELHKGIGILWNDKYGADAKEVMKELVFKKFDFVNEHLSKNKYFTGNDFTAVDAYAFTVINWANFLKIDLTKWTHLVRFMNEVKARPSVQKTLTDEGLLKAA